MSTHLQRVHAHEVDVAAAMQLPKHFKDRRDAFVQILQEGDYKHNYDVLLNKSGTVITCTLLTIMRKHKS